MSRRSRRKHTAEAEINITAFMNLMVVLVPFLLITAVFSQISILELNLPATTPAAQQQEEDKKPIVLEVLIYKNRLEVVDRQTGPLKIIPKVGDQHDFDTLVKTLKAVKNRFPDITEITLLLEANTPYEELVTTMDKVRVTKQVVGTQVQNAELFPDIAIGDAPPDQQKTSSNTSATGGDA
ncbi:MAG: biopolymer transporter ExbD [Pseudomonadales bacterium]|nr:biopolymer transporter ExbD [Pseudomonadales bacterium]RLU02640.1 MAG: biopolymer transporter ExbD [Ketobacter sp.]